MIKFVSFTILITFILISSIQASTEDHCAIPLSSRNDKRFNALSHEAQNMFIMSSLIASQLKPVRPSIEINSTIMLLSHITKIDDQDRGVFHDFSLTNKTLFHVLNRLKILKGFQTFLLSQLGLDNSNLKPFSRKNGELIFHLDEAPQASSIINFNYSRAVDMFLDRVYRLEKDKGSFDRTLTFTELLILLGPAHSFLFKTLGTEDTTKINAILASSFIDLRQKRSQGFYSQEEREEFIQQAIQLFEKEPGITNLEVSKRLDINHSTLRAWLNRHEKENGPITGKQI